MLTNDTLAQWDRENFFHPASMLGAHERGETPTRIISTASGSTLTDRDGKQILDGLAGLYCVNVGYGRPEIADAIADQARDLAYYHAYAGHGTEASVTAAKMILDRAPDGMSKVFFGLGGSDANETNIKLVWHYWICKGQPEKRKIISRWRGYHGSGLLTGSLTGLHMYHRHFGLPLTPVVHTEAPYWYRRENLDQTPEQYADHCAAELDAMIQAEGPDTIAAFIGEPHLGTGGIVPPPPGYWEKIQAVLSKYDILLIADEVVTGFGRMGTPFGSHYYGIKPDLITIAKGVTSAYAPLSGSIVGDKMWKVISEASDKFGAIAHGWTYSAHPIGAAAAVANLKLLDDLNLIENAGKMGTYLRKVMAEAVGDHPHVGEVRGEGLFCGVELVKDRDSRTFFEADEKIAYQVSAAMLTDHGVVGRAMPEGDTIGFAPPFCLTEAEADKLAAALQASIKKVLG